MVSRLAKRYARALLEQCRLDKTIDETFLNLKSLQESLGTSPEFSRFLTDPTFSSQMRKEMIEQLFSRHFAKTIKKFLLFLESKNRLYLFKEIAAAFEDLYFDYKNILRVQVTSGSKLITEQLEEICHSLKEKFHKEIKAECLINHRLLGGVKIKINDLIYDYTLQTQLRMFEERLISA